MRVASVSGGRDSTAMVVKWLESGESLDYVIFCDMGFEFPAMYEYLDKLKAYILRRFSVDFVTLDCRAIFEKWAFEYPISRGERAGRLRGLPRQIGRDFCTREGKANPARDFVLSKSPQKWRNEALIGYTFREVNNGRISNLDYAIAVYPLHAWGWDESHCENFLKSRGIANPLYVDFARTGCYFCPHQSKKALFTIFTKYPREWQKMLDFESRAAALDCVNKQFRADCSLSELAKEFAKTPQTAALWDEGYTDAESCFCK